MKDDKIPNELQALELADVASMLGVSERMVRNYINDNGLPWMVSGKSRRFSWSDVLEWYVSYRISIGGSGGNGASLGEQVRPAENMETAMLRKTVAEADLKELDLAIKRGEVVSIEDVGRNVAQVSQSIKQKLQALPLRLAGDFVGVDDVNVVKATLEREMHLVCLELATVGSTTAKSTVKPIGRDE